MFTHRGCKIPLAFIAPKTLGTSWKAVPPAPRRAVALYNDGSRLGAKRFDNAWIWFSPSATETEVLASLVPGARFIDSTVKFKSYGHTRDGNAVVFFRDKSRGWCVSISVRHGQYAVIHDYDDLVRVLVFDGFQAHLV